MWRMPIILLSLTCLIATTAAEDCSLSYNELFEDRVLFSTTGYFARNSIGGDTFDVIAADEDWTAYQLFETFYDEETSTGPFVGALVDFIHTLPVPATLSTVGDLMLYGSFQEARITFGGLLKHYFNSQNLTTGDYYCEDVEELIATVIDSDLNALFDLYGDRLFAAFLNLEVGSSLSFVMDTTGSMSGEIEAAKERVIDIITTTRDTPDAPLKLVLAPYNDPGVGPVVVTSNPDEFINEVSALVATGGGDFPELAMGGILLAALNSGFRSIVYVFTDASAKDESLIDLAVSVCLIKKISVYFFLTDSFDGMDVYGKVAKETLGQVMVVSKSDVSSATEVLKATTTQGQVMLALVSDYEGTSIPVRVDKSISKLIILFTGTFEYDDYIGPVGDASRIVPITEFPGMKLFHLTNITAGTYIFNFNNVPMLNANIMGKSTLGFHGVLKQKKRGTDIYEAGRRLRAGKNTTADIHIYGRTEGIRFTAFVLFSRTRQVLLELALDGEEGQHHYVIDEPFILPNEPMVAALYGSDGENQIERVDPCAITPTTTESYLDIMESIELLSGTTVTVDATLHNNDVDASFTILAADRENFASVVTSSYFVANSATQTIPITITVPSTAESGVLSQVTVVASTPEYFISATLVVRVIDDIVRCRAVGSRPGSTLHCSDEGLNIGTTCTVTCGVEYRLEGVRNMVCQDDGTWTNDYPGDCVFVASKKCQVWGDPHYTTFDGKQIDFMGECLYKVVETFPGLGVEPISILVENTRNGLATVSFFKEAFVTIYNVTVNFKQGKIIFVDGVKVEVPSFLAGGKIRILLVGSEVEMRTNSGLKINYNGGNNFAINLAGSYMNSVYGLCGNFNDDVTDDLKIGDETFTDQSEFGNFLEVVGGSAPDCRKGEPDDTNDQCTNPAEKAKYQEKCAALKGACFAACSTDEDKELRFQSCVFDMCVTAGKDSVVEDALDSLAAKCQEVGSVICDWRDEFEFPLDCPPHSMYVSRANPCQDTCVDREYSSRCTSRPKVPNCVCYDGFVWSGLECVPVSECGCALGSRYFLNGQVFTSSDCSERCECYGGDITCHVYGCTEGNECRLLTTGVYNCEPERLDHCIASGDPHYKTLDGTWYDFMGKCAYVMVDTVELPEVDSRYIKIIAQNENRNGNTRVSYVRSVTIMVPGHEVMLGPSSAVVTDSGVVTSHWEGSEGTYSVEVAGSTFVFKTVYGIKVTFSGTNLQIDVPSFYISKVRGMCGNYTGFEHDEILEGTNEFASQFVYGDSCEESLEEFECSEEDKTRLGGDEYCGKIFSDAFVRCADVVDPTIYFDNCVFDLCATSEDLHSEMLRNALGAYAAACDSAEVKLCKWEEQTDLTPECPENSRYDSCASFCENTCLKSNAVTGCEIEGTVGKCVCEFGFVRSGGNCIPQEECGCIVGESNLYIERFESHMQDNCTAQITCVARSFTTTLEDPCRDIATCKQRDSGEYYCEPLEQAHALVFGDPIVKTFDNKYIKFHGSCAHLIVGYHEDTSTPCVPSFTVVGQNEMIESPFGDQYSRLKSVKIEFWDMEGHFSVMLEEKYVLINGVEMSTAPMLPPRTLIYIEPHKTIVTFEFGMKVLFSSYGWTRIEVDPKLKGLLYGMAGNYDEDPDNDLVLGEEIMVTEEEWGLHWIVDNEYSDSCDREAPVPEDPCEKSGLMERFARDCDCGILIDPEGPFAACHEKLDPAMYFETCVHDMCVTDGSSRSLVTILMVYQLGCVKKGIRPGNWMDVVKTPVSCGEYSHYEECADPCQPTCGVVSSDCSGECSPGCVCEPGYMMDNGKCVKEGRCGCDRFVGLHVPHGTCYFNDDCSAECTCLNGVHECEEIHCYSDQYCGIRKMEFGCHFTDECEYDNGGCSDTCSFVNGTVKCSCPLGHVLGEDGKKCIELESGFFEADTSECGSTFNAWKQEFLNWKYEILPKWVAELEAYKSGKMNATTTAECRYEWTDWFDRDNSGGCGDDESLERLLREYPDQICKKPLWAEARLADGSKIASVTANYEVGPTGLVCKNAEQPDGGRCPDFAVRFLCPVY